MSPKRKDKEKIVGVGGFRAEFYVDKEIKTVELSSAGVWIILQGREQEERFLFVTQNDRPLIKGDKPVEIASGGVDKQRDKDIFDTAVNEVREETGIELNKDRLIPIAIAIKDKNRKDIEVQLSPSGMQSTILVDEQLLNTNEPLKGGIIFMAVIPFSDLPIDGAESICISRPNMVLKAPIPNGVDPNEIESIVLVPTYAVLDQDSPITRRTSHPWAQNVGLNAIIANAIVDNSKGK